jgi:hypothetical protein
MAKLEQAIALGKGRGAKEVYHFLSGLNHYTREGKRINPWATGQYVDPKTDPNYDRTEPVAYQAGVLQDMPVWDEELLRDFVDREEFARPDPELQKKIEGWIKSGLESHELIAKVRDAGGLVTLQDFGLKPLKEESTDTTAIQGG